MKIVITFFATILLFSAIDWIGGGGGLAGVYNNMFQCSVAAYLMPKWFTACISHHYGPAQTLIRTLQ